MKNESTGGISSSSLNTDNVTVATIRDFLSNESKPESLQPLDILTLIYMMVRKTEDHGITDSQQTLARRLNCSVKSIERSQKRLSSSKIDYLSRARRKGRTSEISLNTEKIPAEATLRSKISPQAESLARWYRRTLITTGIRKRPPKHFAENQTASAQRIIDLCGGDDARASEVIFFALKDPRYQGTAKKSLYHLLGRWDKVVAAFLEKNPPAQTPAPPPAAPPLTPDLLKAKANRILAITDPSQMSDWGAMFDHLFAGGYDTEQIRAVFNDSIERLRPEAMRSAGPEAFSKLFHQEENV